MKRFSIGRSLFIPAVILLLLSGCVTNTSSITIYFGLGEALEGSDQMYVRYSDKSVKLVEINSNDPSPTIVETDEEKTIVGGYVSDGNVSWVPSLSYGLNSVTVTNITYSKPLSPVGYVVQQPDPVADSNSEFVSVTYSVYEASGKSVDDYTEVFAHSTNSDVIFFNTGSGETEVKTGFSSYTEEGEVTFKIKTTADKVSELPISLYSGSKLIYDSNINRAFSALSIGLAEGDTEQNITQNISLPPSNDQKISISWASSNPDVMTEAGIIHKPKTSTGFSDVTMTATISGYGLVINKSFDLRVIGDTFSYVATLSELRLSGVVLDQAFSGQVLSYTGQAPHEVSVTTATYTPDDSFAAVAYKRDETPVSNPIALQVGLNDISVVVTAEDGSNQVYKVAVTRASAPETPTPATPSPATPSPTTAPTPAPAASNPFLSAAAIDVDKLTAELKQKWTASEPVAFTDTASHWAFKDIGIASRLQIIEGFQDGGFKPNASVTRAEFSVMIVRAFGLSKASTGTSFSDLDSQNWSSTYIESLASSGIINGYEDGTFKPNHEITRAEMLTVISRIVNLKALSQNDAPAEFSDISDEYWAKAAIEEAAGAGMINGVSTNQFAPENKATRAEALALIIRSLRTSAAINELLQ
ncbi:S-layer homology domain-containing protein [Paenibacillus sp. 2TAB23]|uniref:S-layer homology domain-containing protein n=1 Tax=Paenibacillus sp. 2TAB23 TaxID=3233004 RepID=UPI003F9BCF0C